MICFTIDIDWASEEVIEDTLLLFENYNVCCTLFATHKSKVLDSCNRNLFEIGLHPNFNPLLQGKGGNVNDVLNKLKEIYPEAIGARSHSLTQSGYILSQYKEVGIEYEVNHFLPYHQNIKPFMLWNGLLRIPFNWEDDYHFALGYEFNDSKINLNDECLNIFNFHPIHIYLNSENNDRYVNVKDNLNDIDYISKYVNKNNVLGTRDILIQLLEHVKSNQKETNKLHQVHEIFSDSKS